MLCCALYCVESRIFLYTTAAIDGVLFYCGGRGFGMFELTLVSKSGGSWGYTTFYFFFWGAKFSFIFVCLGLITTATSVIT